MRHGNYSKSEGLIVGVLEGAFIVHSELISGAGQCQRAVYGPSLGWLFLEDSFERVSMPGVRIVGVDAALITRQSNSAKSIPSMCGCYALCVKGVRVDVG